MKKFKKILIANRGEIATRIIRTCRELGIETVSVYSEADSDSLHVKMADESVCIGPAQSINSYLNFMAVLSAAEITGADAIHPGYGFLSENDEFSKTCREHGFEFIGPNTDCITKMGDKIRSKQIAMEADVPTLEPIHVKDKGNEEIITAVKEMGFPVLIKASAGGGGKGMRRIDQMDDLIPALEVLKTESMAAFGDDTLFIEKLIESARHIEIQILSDKHGNTIHLGERDCTIQRRYQKIVEESPSPVLSDKVREEICASAVRLGKKVGYDSVGTVEYLYDQDTQKYYFMEMNTRIQVEHPVTEQRCGIDLISEQIKSAMGQRLKYTQDQVRFRGHVIEFRINAEDPKTSFPCPGMIDHYHRPAGIGVRVDDFIYTGYQVSPFYDSLISKVIIYGENRDHCIIRSLRALDELVVGGIKTNIELHKSILLEENFRANNYSTSYLQQHLLK